MAITINRVTLVGRVGADPESKGRDGSFVTFSVATSESWKDRTTGERREKTHWHKVVVFTESTAKFCRDYVRKGDLVAVEGQLETREYEEKYYTEVIVKSWGHSVQVQSKERREEDPGSGEAPRRQSSSSQSSGRPGSGRPGQGSFDRGDMDDDIPF